MKNICALAITAAALAAAGCATAGTNAQNRSILVEPPTNLPAIARSSGAEIFLHDTTHGQTLLYIEASDGKSMAILDVTDPGHINAVASVAIQSQAPFYYVQDVSQSKALVRFRNSPGYGLLDFSVAKKPMLSQTDALARAENAEPIDNGALLLSGSDRVRTAQVANAPQHYEILDTSHSGEPTLIAAIPGIKRSVAKVDTGTTFLLADGGITVIRNLRTEEEFATHQNAERQ